MTILKQPLSKLRAKSGSGPRVLIVVASVVTILITLVEMFRGALTVGISTDAPYSKALLERAFENDWERQQFGPPGSAKSEAISLFTRGNAFQALAHVSNVVRGNEEWFSLRYAAETYAVENLTLVSLVFLACIGVLSIMYALTQSSLISLFSCASLSALPAFIGSGVFNTRDIPAAVGITLFTAGGCVFLSSLNTRQRCSQMKTWTSCVLIFIGVFLAIGTRTFFWAYIGMATLTVLVISAIEGYFYRWKRPRTFTGISKLTSFLVSLLLGFCLVVVLHGDYLPYWKQWIETSITASAHFPYMPIGSLVAGQRLSSNDLPWWYLPAWVGASIPLLLIVFIALGTSIGLWKLFGRAQELPSRASYGLVLAQAYALPLAAVVAGSVMYNAQRHHLYMYPALAVLAGVGLKWLLDRSNQSKSANSARVWQWVIAGTAAFALLYPTIERLRLHPYEYTYLNEVATIGGINGRWETDYYNASLREAITRVPPDLYPYFYAPPENMDTYFYLRGLNYDPKNVASEDEYWRINVTVSGREMPGNCRDVDSVTRNFRGEDVVMSWVGICKKLPGGPSETQ